MTLNDSIHQAEPVFQSWMKSRNMIQFGEKRIKIVHRGNSRLADTWQSAMDLSTAAGDSLIALGQLEGIPDSGPFIPVDYLVVTQNARHDPGAWREMFSPGMVILDASNSYWTVQQWSEACDAAGIACWPIRELGGYVGNVR